MRADMAAFGDDLQEYTIWLTGRISASIGRQIWARGVAHPAAAGRILPKGVQKGVHHYTVFGLIQRVVGVGADVSLH